MDAAKYRNRAASRESAAPSARLRESSFTEAAARLSTHEASILLALLVVYARVAEGRALLRTPREAFLMEQDMSDAAPSSTEPVQPAANPAHGAIHSLVNGVEEALLRIRNLDHALMASLVAKLDEIRSHIPQL
jgi:hypothetical protein